MNFKITDSDSIAEVIKNRISYFKELHERHADFRLVLCAR